MRTSAVAVGTEAGPAATGPLADGAERPEQVIRVESVSSGYGGSLVVKDVSISAGRGEIVAVVGPNGSGKSTLLKTMAGLVAASAGRIWHGDVDVTALPGEARARRGIAYLPQEREVFASLTVRENLLMGGFALDRRAMKAALDRVHGSYPVLGRLGRTPAGKLSGGERKTVAMARVMMSSPSVVLLDEPTASLAPIPSAQLLEHDVPALAAAGVTVVLVEQRAVQAVAVSDWVYLLAGGAVELQRPARDIGGSSDLIAAFLGAGGRRQPAADGARARDAAAEGDGDREPLPHCAPS
jgi:ABC-type branched-subunit amino acid transport system ATPase component